MNDYRGGRLYTEVANKKYSSWWMLPLLNVFYGDKSIHTSTA